MNTYVKFIIIFILLAGCLFLLHILIKKPSNDRVWSADAEVLQSITLLQNSFSIDDLRDWSYADGKVLTQDYKDVGYDFSNLENIYFQLQYLDKNNLTAHTYLVFDFGEESIGLSIEARKEKGESYSSVRGLFNTYELIYVWATAEDHDTRRTDLYQNGLESHRLVMTHSEQEALLRSLLEDSMNLVEHPRFYNTLFDNCTSLLAKNSNSISFERIPWHYSFILTGFSVSYLEKLGYIEKGDQ